MDQHNQSKTFEKSVASKSLTLAMAATTAAWKYKSLQV